MSEIMERISDSVELQVISAKSAANRGIERAKNAITNETGAVDIVVILLLICLVIAIIAIFKDSIMDLIEKVFGQLDSAASSTASHK